MIKSDKSSMKISPNTFDQSTKKQSELSLCWQEENQSCEMYKSHTWCTLKAFKIVHNTHTYICKVTF